MGVSCLTSVPSRASFSFFLFSFSISSVRGGFGSCDERAKTSLAVENRSSPQGILQEYYVGSRFVCNEESERDRTDRAALKESEKQTSALDEVGWGDERKEEDGSELNTSVEGCEVEKREKGRAEEIQNHAGGKSAWIKKDVPSRGSEGRRLLIVPDPHRQLDAGAQDNAAGTKGRVAGNLEPGGDA